MLLLDLFADPDWPISGRPVLVDLFAGEGGCTAGYEAAGFAVFAVDSNPAAVTNNPASWGAWGGDWSAGLAFALETLDVAAIHASPPCQAYSITRHAHNVAHPRMIDDVRAALVATGLPYVIENVDGAPLLDPVTLCGSQFELTTTDEDGTPLHLKRHRLFESNRDLKAPGPCVHTPGVQWAGAYGGARRDKVEARLVRKGGYVPASLDVLRRLLGVDWMTEAGVFQAIPPVYTEHLGRQLLTALER